VSSERLPALPQIQSHASISSTSSSPRGDSISSGSAGGGSAGSSTSYAASVNGQALGLKTPSPELTPQQLGRDDQSVNTQPVHSSPFSTQDAYGFAPCGYNSMNQMQSYADVHQPHMATATHAPASAPPTGLSHYSYPPQSSMMQPQHQYSQAPPGYPPYGYGNGVPSQIPASSSMNPAMVPSTLQLPGLFENGNHTMHKLLTITAMSSGAPASSIPGSQGYQTQTFDHTGQVAPPGMKPRVTATLWEDEGSLCFQVEAKGVCVARREGECKPSHTQIDCSADHVQIIT
jgi:protein SOK2